MSATTWFIIAIVGFSFSGIFLIVSIFIFLKMNIPSVVGDLSGKTIAKEIKAMRQINEKNGEKIYKPSMANIDRGKVSEKTPMDIVHLSKRLDLETNNTVNNSELNKMYSQVEIKPKAKTPITENLSENTAEIPVDRISGKQKNNKKTEILSRNQYTEELYSYQDPEKPLQSPKTDMLMADKTSQTNSTTVLSDNSQLTEQLEMTPVALKIIRNHIVVHTSETID